jgi:heme exporter protein D
MYFQSLDAILHMDGHGAFVWSAYLISAVVILFILVSPGRRRRRFLKQLAGEAKRQGVVSDVGVSD